MFSQNFIIKHMIDMQLLLIKHRKLAQNLHTHLFTNNINPNISTLQIHEYWYNYCGTAYQFMARKESLHV